MLTPATDRTPMDMLRGIPEMMDDTALGWYLYGVTRNAPIGSILAHGGGATHAMREHASLELLEHGALAAVVKPVLLAEFSAPVLQERLRSATALETIVRDHNRVIECVHARQAILPAKFGSVYVRASDVMTALRSEHDKVLARLARVEGCDEWALHLYADRAVVRAFVSAADSGIGRMREARAAARPGRAYFLDRQLMDEVESATDEALTATAQRAFDRLSLHAVDARVNVAGRATGDELEILRAAFLVRREQMERFQTEVQALADGSAGLRCEPTGPWPPYTFAALDAEDLQ